MSINTTQLGVSDLLKAIERQKLDELNERRKANVKIGPGKGDISVLSL